MLVIAVHRAIMSRNSKWIDADSPDEPAADVAKRAIRARLKTFREWMELVDRAAEDDIEPVHQLRVSTRRAMAALDIFAQMLPAKRTKRMAKHLKSVRKAAGNARDLDVLAKRLATVCPDAGTADCAALLDRLARERRAAAPIGEICKKLKSRCFSGRVKKLVRRTRWRQEGQEPSFLEAARVGLQPVAATFFAAAEGDFESTLALHEFRIASKQLRYAMELFAAAFDAGFRKELYPLVEQLQEKLGEINDYAIARDRYLVWLDETMEDDQRRFLGKLIAMETAALQESTRRFREWWTPARATDLKVRFWREISPSEARCA